MDFLKNRKYLLAIVFLIVVFPLIIALALKNGAFTKSKPSSSPQPAVHQGYLCPTTAELCQSGKDIIKDTYLGFGVSDGLNHPIYAIFDGNVTVSQTILPKELGGETLQTVYIDNGQENLRAVYLYKGREFAPDNVQKGVIIGKMEEEIKAYNTWLIFQLIKGDPLKGERFKLSSQDFK